MLAGQRKLVKRDTRHVWKSNFMPEKTGIEIYFRGREVQENGAFCPVERCVVLYFCRFLIIVI